GRQPGAVGHQLFYRDPFLSLLAKLRDVMRHRFAEADLALLDENHYRGRGSDDLGERREVEHRVEGHRLPLGRDRAVAKGFSINHTAVAGDENDGAGYFFALDCLARGFIDVGKTFG